MMSNERHDFMARINDEDGLCAEWIPFTLRYLGRCNRLASDPIHNPAESQAEQPIDIGPWGSNGTWINTTQPSASPEATKEHQWTGVRAGGSPSEAGSYEYVRYCKVCGMEDTCEDPLPPCPGDSPEPSLSLHEQAVKDVAEALGYSAKTIALDYLCPSGSDGLAIQYAVQQRERVLALEQGIENMKCGLALRSCSTVLIREVIEGLDALLAKKS